MFDPYLKRDEEGTYVSVPLVFVNLKSIKRERKENERPRGVNRHQLWLYNFKPIFQTLFISNKAISKIPILTEKHDAKTIKFSIEFYK